ncbi:MAG: Cys-Xaa-Xaa-Xaa repeat radical SAM target protein [Prevotella sp.]|nr:Cys-Xaa-Xaa-Xaa repeat radical SAM target protein [Prevotella sp.]
MKKNKKNEELQSRREFFKKAAKGALPILGAIVLSSVPNVVNAMENAPNSGCRTCSGSCTTTCGGCCTKWCTGTCTVTCGGACTKWCTGSSK